MRLGGEPADTQALRDLLVGEPAGDELGHFMLASGQIGAIGRRTTVGLGPSPD